MDDGVEQDDVHLVPARGESTGKPVNYPFGAIAAEVGDHERDMQRSTPINSEASSRYLSTALSAERNSARRYSVPRSGDCLP